MGAPEFQTSWGCCQNVARDVLVMLTYVCTAVCSFWLAFLQWVKAATNPSYGGPCDPQPPPPSLALRTIPRGGQGAGHANRLTIKCMHTYMHAYIMSTHILLWRRPWLMDRWFKMFKLLCHVPLSPSSASRSSELIENTDNYPKP